MEVPIIEVLIIIIMFLLFGIFLSMPNEAKTEALLREIRDLLTIIEKRGRK